MIKENIPKSLIRSFLEDFKAFLQSKELRKQHHTYYTVKDFDYKINRIMMVDDPNCFKRERKISNNTKLIHLAKEIHKLYPGLTPLDLRYHIINLLCKVCSWFLWGKKKSINLDYYFTTTGYCTIYPPDGDIEYDDFFDTDEGADFFCEVMDRGISKIEQILNDQVVEISLKFLVQNHSGNRQLSINNSTQIILDDNSCNIICRYTEKHLYNKMQSAHYDLKFLIVLLEVVGIIVIKDTNKSFSREKMSFGLKEIDSTLLSIIPNISGKEYGCDIDFLLHHLKDKFYQKDMLYTDADRFYILDKRVPHLYRFASLFLSSDIHRYSSQEFLKYWQCIEILCGSPDSNIFNSIEKQIEEWSFKTQGLGCFWCIRNSIVHRGKLEVEQNQLEQIKIYAQGLLLHVIKMSLS